MDDLATVFLSDFGIFDSRFLATGHPRSSGVKSGGCQNPREAGCGTSIRCGWKHLALRGLSMVEESRKSGPTLALRVLMGPDFPECMLIEYVFILPYRYSLAYYAEQIRFSETGNIGCPR